MVGQEEAGKEVSPALNSEQPSGFSVTVTQLLPGILKQPPNGYSAVL